MLDKGKRPGLMNSSETLRHKSHERYSNFIYASNSEFICGYHRQSQQRQIPKHFLKWLLDDIMSKKKRLTDLIDDN